MNRKQWFVLGVGLVLLGFFIGFVSGGSDCSELVDRNIELIEKGADSTLDEWVISCLDMKVYNSLISTIIFTLGVIFVIMGFLEPKKKKIGGAKQ